LKICGPLVKGGNLFKIFTKLYFLGRRSETVR
jgi:hypothetical protein